MCYLCSGRFSTTSLPTHVEVPFPLGAMPSMYHVGVWMQACRRKRDAALETMPPAVAALALPTLAQAPGVGELKSTGGTTQYL